MTPARYMVHLTDALPFLVDDTLTRPRLVSHALCFTSLPPTLQCLAYQLAEPSS